MEVDPGFCNLEFSKSSSVRGQLLNEWELERIALAERSYMTPKGMHQSIDRIETLCFR
jgi:hypothetical protein